MYKSFKHFALNIAHQFGVLRGISHLEISRANSLYVLVYHRVDRPTSQSRLDPQNLSATPEQFDEHMRLISNEYHPVSAEDLLEVATYDRKLPPRAVLVTVDDGYCDFKNYIWPIANRHGVRPMLFVSTAYVGAGVFWWDKLYDALQRTTLSQVDTPVGILPLSAPSDRHSAFAQLANYMKKSPFNSAIAALNDVCRDLVPDPYSEDHLTLNWDELRELAKAGATIAPHAHTHPALGNIDLDQARFEVSESQRLIASEIGVPGYFFAYPYGSRSSIGTVAGEVLRESGCQFAFTMIPGRAHLDEDRMYLPRIASYPQMTITQLHSKLTPIFDLSTRRQA